MVHWGDIRRATYLWLDCTKTCTQNWNILAIRVNLTKLIAWMHYGSSDRKPKSTDFCVNTKSNIQFLPGLPHNQHTTTQLLGMKTECAPLLYKLSPILNNMCSMSKFWGFLLCGCFMLFPPTPPSILSLCIPGFWISNMSLIPSPYEKLTESCQKDRSTCSSSLNKCN